MQNMLKKFFHKGFMNVEIYGVLGNIVVTLWVLRANTYIRNKLGFKNRAVYLERTKRRSGCLSHEA